MKNSLKQNFKFKPKKEQKKIEFDNNITKEKNMLSKSSKENEIQITIDLSSNNKKSNKSNNQIKKQIPMNDKKIKGMTKQNSIKSSLKKNDSKKNSFINKKNNINSYKNITNHDNTKKVTLKIKDVNDKNKKIFKFKPKKISTNRLLTAVTLTNAEKHNQKLNNSNSSNQIKTANYKKDFYIPRVCASLIGNNLDSSFSSNNSYSRLNFSEIRRQHLLDRKNSLNVSTHSSSSSNYNSNENTINFNFEKVLDDLNGIIELNQKNIINKDDKLQYKRSHSLSQKHNCIINELKNINIKNKI
jgi:hypothetical protein